MSKRKKNPFLSGKILAATIGLFALTLSTSTMATFAWFQVSDFARIEQIGMKLDDSTTMQIGYRQGDGILYQDKIDENDLRIIDSNYDRNVHLRDVTSAFSSEWLNTNEAEKTPILRVPYGKSKENTMTEAATEGFIQAEAFLRCSQPCHLYLGHNTSATVIERWNRELAAQTGYSEDELNKVLDCVRVSFYTKDAFYIAEPGQEEASKTVFAGPLQARNNLGYYDSEDGKEILYGEYEGEPSYLPAPETDEKDFDDDSAFHAIHKAGIEKVDVSSVKPAVEKSYPLSSFILPEKAVTAGDTLCLGTLHPNEDYRIVISIYIEGWDLDLTDSLATGKFSLDLSFVGLMDII